MSPPGLFVAIEGTDGSGKSAAARQLVSRLVRDGLPATLVDPKRPVIPDEFLTRRMRAHAAILWEHGRDEPRDQLRDEHWVHLSASWYHAVAQHAIEPALERPQIVVADGWFYKLLARFTLKDPRIAKLAEDSYSGIFPADVVCLLDVDPQVAASRKSEFGFSETGNFDGHRGVTRENFIAYQSRVRTTLLVLAQRWQWEVVCVDDMDIGAVVEYLSARVLASSGLVRAAQPSSRP